MEKESYDYSCPRYKGQITKITEYYRLINGKRTCVNITCSLQNSSPRYRCNGMEDDANKCAYIDLSNS